MTIIFIFYTKFALSLHAVDFTANHRQISAILSPMKSGYLWTLMLVILTMVMAGCTSKTVTYFNKITLLGNPWKKVDNPMLQEVAEQIVTDANATLLYKGDLPPAESSGTTLFLTDKYLKIYFNTVELYRPGQTTLGKTMRSRLNHIIPTLKKYPALIIQIIGHAYEEGKAKKMRHYADNRAISVAEYLYTAGLKQEILAKGCADQVPKELCPQNRPHPLCAMHNRRIEIFLYSSKKDVITRCR